MEYCYIKSLWYLERINIWRRVHFDIYRGEYFLHKMIMIFLKGSIYADVFILIFTEYCYIKYVWYLSNDQYMQMMFILIFTERCCYIKWRMIFVKGSIYADVYFDIYIFYIKWLSYLIKGSIYGDVFILIFTEYFCIKWLWYLSKDQYMEMCLFWYLQSRVFFT